MRIESFYKLLIRRVYKVLYNPLIIRHLKT